MAISRPFALGRYEVTVGEYGRFAAATGREVKSHCHVYKRKRYVRTDNASWREPGFRQADDHPVVCVNWEDARAYVGWLSRETGEPYRLPSDAEWEYAARAGAKTRYHFGNDESDLCRWGNGADHEYLDWHPHEHVADCRDGHVHTAPVGSFRANGWGLQDMNGNVWEWVADCWDPMYLGDPGNAEPLVGNCEERALRGGSWHSGPVSLRPTYRFWFIRSDRYNELGFRVARTLAP